MLETEFLKLKYHNNVETNTDEVNAEEYFNNNYKKIDANAKSQDAKITNLQNKVNSLEQQKNMLAQQQPWNTVAGDSIHIEDSAEWGENRLSLSGNLRQEKREGYNIMPNNLTSGEIDGVKYTVNADKSITLNGTATNTIYLYLLNNTTKSITAGNYIISTQQTGNYTGVVTLNIRYGSSGTAYGCHSNENFKTLNFSEDYRYNRAYIFIASGAVISNLKIYPMLEKTEANTPRKYESYGAMPSTEFSSMPQTATGVQKIRQFGKNLFDKDNANILNAYTNSTITASANSKILYVKCKSLTTYTISRAKIGKRFQVGECSELPKIGSSLANLTPANFANELKSITINTSLSAKYLVVFYSNSANDNANNNGYTEEELKDSIQIEESSIATFYEPYIENLYTLNLGSTELCKITDENGNVVAQDRAVYRNGKWQWEKNVEKIIYNGTEDWRTSFVDNSVNTVRFAKTLPKPSGSQKLSYNNLFKTRMKEAHTDTEYLYLVSATIYININTDKLTSATVEAFKKWLSTHNLVVYYILETPEYIDCTAEQSKILDKLYNNFKLNKGTNNIIVESGNGVGVDMDLTYMQDLLTKLNLLEAMCVSNASQEV